MTARIAYLTGRSYRGVPMQAGDTPELERKDRDLIAAAGRAHGVAFETCFWDEPELTTRGFDAALIRSCWDYSARADDFINTIAAHERAGLPVWNNADVIRWNSQKTYLKELGSAAIETLWVERADTRAVALAFDTLDASEIVVKPQVGAGSIETLRLKRNAWSEADLIAGPRGAAMIQPYLSGIEAEGERSLIWFGGAFSHAIRKVPAAGGWLANIPGKTRFFAEPAPPAAREAAEAALAYAPLDLLYVRVDVVLGDDGRWRVMEIEAIEPYLFLNFAPEGADFFAAAIARVLG